MHDCAASQISRCHLCVEAYVLFFLRAVSFETTRCVRDLITSLLGTICDVMQISI